MQLDAKTLRSAIGSKNSGVYGSDRNKYSGSNRNNYNGSRNTSEHTQSDNVDPKCPICDAAGRRNIEHHLSQCKFLPSKDKMLEPRTDTPVNSKCSINQELILKM